MTGNAFLDATEYANTMLLLLKNQLVAGRLVDGQFRNEVTDENGLTINIKRPPQFVAQDGEALRLQSVVNGSTTVEVDQYKNVHVDVGDLEYIQSYNQLVQDETMKSAASELAHVIDAAVHGVFREFSTEVGVVGNVIGSPLEFNKVHTQLMDQSVPNSDLSSVVTFADGEEIRGSLIGGDIQNVNRSALERTRIPILSEVDVFASNNTQYITPGTRTQVVAIDAADQNVNYRDVLKTMTQTLDLKGLTDAQTIEPGAVFTIADVFAVNNRSRQVLPYLRQFTVIATANQVVSGTTATVTISPPIIVPGTSDGVDPGSGIAADEELVNTAFQTVSAAPGDDAVVTFNTAPSATAYPVRVAFHKKAISLVSARLRTPFSDTSSFVSDPQTGIGIRYWRGSDITSGRHIHRWDTVFGVQALQRELGSRVNGT